MMLGEPRRRLTLVLAALVAVAVVAVGAVVITRLVGTDRSTPTAGPTGPSASADAPPSPSPSTPPPGADITGPLNLLLVGIDTRVSVPGWEPHADAVLILHVPAGLSRAYLFSLPRDLVVDIPAFEPAGYRGGRTKLTNAMSYGSRVPDRPKQPDPAQGYELLSQVVSDYTGLRIDAGAVLTFGGFDELVDSLGGVDIHVDQRVVSRHRQPDGKHRSPGPGVGGYVGPQMVYEPGDRHLNGWQALDYARQRYLPGGDYTRQRHQQQLIRSLVGKILDTDLARQPERVEQVVAALGDMLVYVGGRRIVEFAYALGGLSPDALTLVTLPGAAVGRGNAYRGEELTQTGRRFITELRAGKVDEFLAEHPKLVVPR
ncbi:MULTISPECIES: LCP family protein [Micromonospora]|uniref:Transcriptional regulator n=2 Tax=Micromonospora TaxID=1873 RepID=A0A9X0I411_9ACTN|nr:LytR/CpsA family cell envelope-related function transcriptional attenuator [Micromonospora maris AB-18-032]KUJ46324.1 transcriptional regulator [Micromonospora maris]RUL93587.1 LytR family transcriptional regulator [Verrucosispora sp. FIM060022]